MPDDWRKIERGLFESADGRYRIANPHKLTTELRHRWLVAERRASGSGWCMHDGPVLGSVSPGARWRGSMRYLAASTAGASVVCPAARATAR
jgi:hypothetical protein